MANQMYVTPVGTAVYPWLNNPDTRFDADGVYQVTLQLSKEDTKPINAVVKPLMDGGKNNPIKPELDDQGNATGNYLVKFKLKALVKPKKSEPFTQSPVLLDEDGNRLDALIAGGSKMKIAYEPFAYSAMGGGVSLRVKKVRMAKGGLIEYVAKDANLDWGDDCIDKPKKEEPVAKVEVLDDMSSPDLDDEDF
jgi:hypothetical protein|tara:strand:- start:1659 stop:2237 length:579 start_codon:yes stop_codon:yes gene_type:complete